ncbi:MAG: thioredoxin family protein [Sulfuricurvum sp.]|nr:thioredoxin family protein [Sulfuricurvum sp.]
MKALIILLFFVYTSFAISSADAAFVLGFHEEYPTALTQAKKEKKLLMLVIIQDPCPYSERLVYNTLSDPKVVEALKGIVSVIVDRRALFPPQFKAEFVPMTFIIDPDNEEGIGERMGYISAEEFLVDIKEAYLLYKKK